MSEKLQPRQSAWDVLTGGIDSSDWDERQYYRQRLESIRDGEPTWMAQNFDSDGIAFIYYVESQPVGQLHVGGWDTRGFEAYYLYGSHDFGESFDTIEEAKSSIEFFGEVIQRVYLD